MDRIAQAAGSTGQEGEPGVSRGTSPVCQGNADSARRASEGGARDEIGPRGEGASKGARFRALLKRPSRAANEAAAMPPEVASGPPLPRDLAPREISVRAIAPQPSISRVLVAHAQSAKEARIELGGPLAGSAIHVATGPSGIEVRVAAPNEVARAALAEVIDRARLRLGSRGIVVRPGAPLQSGSRHSQRERRDRG